MNRANSLTARPRFSPLNVSLFNSKRGDGPATGLMQIAAIVLFAFFLFIAIYILSMQKSHYETNRPALGEDLINQKASVMLTNILRAETDITLGDTTYRTNVANAIIIAEMSPDSTKALAALRTAIGKTFPPNTRCHLYVNYPVGVTKITGASSLSGQYHFANSAAYTFKTTEGVAKTKLPGTNGNIELTLNYIDTDYCAINGLDCPLVPYVYGGDTAPLRGIEKK